MTQAIYFVEMHSPDLATSRQFFTTVFGWDPQPFADPSYLVSPAGDSEGVDSALVTSRDGAPRTVPFIRVESLDGTLAAIDAAGGMTVVQPFTIPGVGRGAYITDPAGMLVGLHQYDPDAR